MKMSEVYRVDSIETKEIVFIAAWEDANMDWSNQKALLRDNIHPIDKLQKHFNKYGERDLTMAIVKKVNSEKAIRDEIIKCKNPVIEKEESKLPDFLLDKTKNEKNPIKKKQSNKKKL